jgi:uroporphyrinogen decarboxylase
MSGDKMTNVERWKAIFNGDPVDRVPVFPLCQGHSVIANGHANVGAYYEFPDVAYRCGKITREMYGYDQPIAFLPPGYFSAEWGSKIMFPYNPKMGATSTTDCVVKTPEDVEKLQVPDPKTCFGFKELTTTLKKAIANKDQVYFWQIAGCITACCPMIVSVETLMRWLRKQPDVAKKLIAKTYEFGVRSAEYFARELGPDNFLVVDGFPTDSNVLISPKQFEEFTLPYLARYHQKVLDTGIPMIFSHWCSNHNANIKAGHIDKIPMGKPGMIHFGPEVDVRDAVARFGKKSIIVGNVDPVAMLLKTHEEVVQLARQDIEKGKNSPKGYMLGVGCEMAPRTPPANVYALVKASREYGKY